MPAGLSTRAAFDYVGRNPANRHYEHPDIQRLVAVRNWRALPPPSRIGAVYDFIRNEIAFGYNEGDELPASRVLTDGVGRCNTKSTLPTGLLRAA